MDSRARRLPGRPLGSPCEHPSSRRGRAVPVRPQGQHGPGAQLASGLHRYHMFGSVGPRGSTVGMNGESGTLFPPCLPLSSEVDSAGALVYEAALLSTGR